MLGSRDLINLGFEVMHSHKSSYLLCSFLEYGVKWFTEFGHLNRGDMLTSEQHRCHNEKKKFQRRV
nr:hypothetical protein [Escherichia coli]